MLEISLLGKVNIRLDGQPITHFRSQKELALLIFLAHSGQSHNREAVADLLWEASSSKQSLSNLRTTLARLRKQVGDHLVVTPKSVAVTPVVHEQTDSVQFQAILAGAGQERSVPGTNLLVQGLAMYRGEFLAGFSLPQNIRFSDWLVVEQERLHQIAMRGYRQLAGWQEEQGSFTEGVNTAQKWVTWDPLDETAQQQLMRLLVYDGRTAEALTVYEKCEHLLQAELGIPPAPATRALYQAIQKRALPKPIISTAPLHNLPRALRPLFGRIREIEELRRYLLNPDYPLISITGAGGMGKTSLALATGRRLLAEEKHPFKDGIWFVPLEGITGDSPEFIKEKVATLVGLAMGTYFHADSDLWSQILGQLASKDLLLILDNIEQFLSVASGIIVDLLEVGQGIHLLVTSRTTPAVSASVAYPLAGLEIPSRLSDEALQNESVRLFAERAARLPAPFHLEKHLAEVVAICQFVEGMPLAIELAAASLGRLMVEEILPALKGNLKLLGTTHSDIPTRQLTLQAVFDSTWQLLDPDEQRLLAQISVFRAGFTRQAAEAVLDDPAPGLYNLTRHALLYRNDLGRFRMHSLLSQLAWEKLSGPGMIKIAAQTLDRHSSYYARLLRSLEDDLRRGAGQVALQTLLPEQTNLQAAWQHAVRTGQWQLIAGCLDSFHYFYQRMGYFSEEATLVDEAITALQASTEVDDIQLATLLSRLLSVRTRGYLNSAQFETGLDSAEQACELAHSLERPDLEALARLAWARILSKQHKRPQALAQFEKVVALAKIAQNPILEADGLIGIGAQVSWQSDVQSADEVLLQALDLCQALQYKPGERESLMLLGNQAGRKGERVDAVSYYQHALELSRLLGDVKANAEALGSIGVWLTALGDLIGSSTHLSKALEMFRRLNMPESEQWMLGQLGYTSIQLGDYASAEKQLAEALVISERIKDEFWHAWVGLRLGEMWNQQGKPEAALSYIAQAYQIAEQLKYQNFKAAVLYDWGDMFLSLQEFARAEQKYQEAYDLRHGTGRIEEALPALAGLAYVSYRLEKLKTAATQAELLWQTWQETPAMAERANLKLYWMLGMVWEGLGDNRAGNLWDSARALLLKRCEKIPDEGARKMFLEQVPAHRAILEAAGL